MTYATLQDDFRAYVKRSDLDAMLPRFVALFEERANRRLRVRQQETAFSGTISSGVIALPADWLAFKRLQTTDWPLNQVTRDKVMESTGAVTAYAIDGSNVRFNGSGSVTGTYFAKVPGLVANSTNWLLSVAYDAYLFGALSEAFMYTMDEQTSAMYMARADGVISELIAADLRDRNSGLIASRKQ